LYQQLFIFGYIKGHKLDTNAVIYALNGGLTFPSANYSISIITEIELFSYAKLTELERENIEKLLNHFKIYNIDKEIKDMTIEGKF